MRSADLSDNTRRNPWPRWLLSTAVLVPALLAHPAETLAQTCQPADVHQRYTGTVTLHNGPGCGGATHINLAIVGPDHEPSGNQGYSYFYEADGNVGCPVDTLNFYWNATGGHDGHWNFSASLAGYWPSDPTDGAICDSAFPQCGCDGGTSIVLYPIDEAPEMRCLPGGASGGSPPRGNVGGPVNVVTGNVWFDQTDTRIPGVGDGLVLVRSYNSKLAGSSIGGGFGRGWFHSFESGISFLPGNVIKLRRGDGEPVFFEDPTSSGTYSAMLPRTETSSIVHSGSTYTRTFRAGGSEVYSEVDDVNGVPVSGLLTSVTDPSGNVTTLTRDPAGKLLSVADAGGRTLTFAYGGDGRVSSLTGPMGVIASYLYDGSGPSGRLQTVTYGDGSGYSFAYDTSARILSVTDLSGVVLETHTYDGNGRGITSEISGGQEKYTLAYGTRRTVVTDALGNVTNYEWTSLEGITRRITETEGTCGSCGGAGQNEQWTYDSSGRVLSHTDALANVTTYTYYSSGDLFTETDALNHTTTYTYDTQGRVLTATRPDGGITTYTHGPSGPLTITEKVTTSHDRTTTLTYTAQGKPWTITDPRSKTTTLGYNGFGDLTSVTDALNHATGFGYDGLGRRTTVTDALTHTTTTTYDARGRVTRITSHDGTHTDFTYDLVGRRTGVTDPMGRTMSYSYDPYGRLQSVTDPLQGVTTYAYDVMSKLVSLTDGRGKVTSFAYDNFNRLTSVTYPGGAEETFTYDEAGRLLTKTDRKSVVTTYAYDELGRLTGKTYSDSTPAVSYTYDTVGRLLTAGNGTDNLTWAYDLAGQLLSETSTKNASTVAYTYDDGGNRLSVSLNGSVFVTYAYDDASRLTTITRGTNNIGFGYDNANRRTSLTYPNGINTGYTYDTLNRLTRLKADLGATPITDFQYTYDAAGNRTRKQQLDYTEDYSYDPLYRLTGATRNGTANQWVYSYDAVGNRTTAQADDVVSTATYNDLNQLVSQTGGGPLRVRGHLDEPGTVTVNGQAAHMLAGNVYETTINSTSGTNTISVVATDVSGNLRSQNFQVTLSATPNTLTYDLNGNLTQKTEAGNTWTYEWNAENQLIRVFKNGGLAVVDFSYDPLGRRLSITNNTQVLHPTSVMLYDGEDILRMTSSSTVPTAYFIHGPGIDEPMAKEWVGSPTSVVYHHQDALGSVVATTDESGALYSTVRYDAWGNEYDWWGNLEMGVPWTYAFTGRELDSMTGLYYYRARYYDPKIGRFVRQDPIQWLGGMNFYAYVGNNPANNVDPFGLAGIGPGYGVLPIPFKASPTETARGPDFYAFSCQFLQVVQFSVEWAPQASLYYSGGAGLPVGCGCSITANWLWGAATPARARMENFMTGQSYQGGWFPIGIGVAGFGGSATYVPGQGWGWGVGFGFGTPTGGGSGSYGANAACDKCPKPGLTSWSSPYPGMTGW